MQQNSQNSEQAGKDLTLPNRVFSFPRRDEKTSEYETHVRKARNVINVTGDVVRL